MRSSSGHLNILTINTGSSSLKAGLYHVAEGEQLQFSCTAAEIGTAAGRLTIRGANGSPRQEKNQPLATHVEALTTFLAWLREQGEAGRFDAAGHRIVVGSREFLQPERLTPSRLAALQALVPLAPDHLPQALAAIDCVVRAFPELPQATCSDSAFHRTLPEVARLYPLPLRWRERGIAKFGFHGLSCEYVLAALRGLEPALADRRLIVAHLGNGASMTAVHHGGSIETTMGLTPAGGLLMSSRSGDLDPGVLIYLLTSQDVSADNLNQLMNHESGLRGIAGTGGMRELLAREAGDPAAALAIACFVHSARKYLGGLAAALGGVDGLIFTGGIGENSAVLRERICAGMQWMGIQLDAERNRGGGPVISPDRSTVQVRVIATDEDRMIVRHTAAALGKEPVERRQQEGG